MAIGIFNQFIYVDPDRDIVIVKLSANPEYVVNPMEEEHVKFFRKIARNFKKQDEPGSFFSWLFWIQKAKAGDNIKPGL